MRIWSVAACGLLMVTFGLGAFPVQAVQAVPAGTGQAVSQPAMPALADRGQLPAAPAERMFWAWQQGPSQPAVLAPGEGPTLTGSRSRPRCGSKTTCAEMNSCEEAMYFLNQCGQRRLDRDGDGIPCESGPC